MTDQTPPRTRRVPTTERPRDPADADQEQLFGDLSGIAREAVRSPADPRLDAHLAFLGLADAPAADAPAGTGVAGDPRQAAEPVAVMVAEPAVVVDQPAGDASRSTLQADVDQLRVSVARLQTEAATHADRLRQLTFVIGVLAIATVVALIIGIVR